jgi:endonuclease/exonuclease/phosphatase family metal-dependent hydrolase
VYRVGTALASSLLLAFNAGCTAPKRNAAFTAQVERSAAVQFPSSVRGKLTRHQEPAFPTYEEALVLMKNPEPHGKLKSKLEALWRTPIIDNSAYLAGKRPMQARTPTLGPFLRVASWNIEKSFHITSVAEALASQPAYEGMLHTQKRRHGTRARAELLRQRERLATADVIFLQEMDIGVSRSGYVDAARTLAKALGMNYAYAVQAIEVDPVMLGLEPVSVDRDGTKHFLPVDKARYKGGFGSAVLSRYPIVNARVVPLKQVYDWHGDERKIADPVEHGRRIGSKIAFDSEIRRELKVGGRCFFRVDIAVPQVPGGVVTLVNNHLEIKTTPKGREEQMVEILGRIKNVQHPIIMAGDHNSAPEDLSPTSLFRVVWRQVHTPEAMLHTAARVSDLVTGTVVPGYRERSIVNVLKNFQNPLAPDIPILFPNPVRGMFEQVRDHRFSDGTSFDFRGNADRSINRSSLTLANSNEHRRWGHRTTFAVRRPIGPIGRYRLDWFFVRSGHLKDPNDDDAPYVLAPHFGETLAEFNDSVKPKFSDHRPIVVDIPLQEPPGLLRQP